jgi:hypothetical protein
MESVPEEWQGKIERIVSIGNGRTVAIADLDPDKKDLLRVLELNTDGQWIDYEPMIGISPAYEEYFGREWQENLPIPELKQPLYDINGEQFPLGYLGKIQISNNPILVERFWYSGVIAGVREIPEQKCVEFVVSFMSKTGDYQYVSFIFANYSQQVNFINSHIYTNVDSAMLIDGKYKSTDFIMTSSKINPRSIKPFAQYMLHNDVVGIQIAVGINASSKDSTEIAKLQWDRTQKLKDILKGNSSISNSLHIPPFMAWIFPESMQNILTY